MNKVSVKLRAAMTRKNVAPDVITKSFIQYVICALWIPRPHAISFAILAYGSAYESPSSPGFTPV
jgi:hypothetical protein